MHILPFIDSQEHPESLYSYYLRLCEVSDLICYPWIAQVFSGLSLAEVKKAVDEVMLQGTPIALTYYRQGKAIQHTVYPPKIFRGMTELYQLLQKNGIDVYVMTAANEEIVRMVASDPRYGYGVKPENVIGVNVLLKDPLQQTVTTSRLQIQQQQYEPAKNLSLHFTEYLVNPMTWFEGKAGSILGWISQWQAPILVAGDTPLSDGYMLLNSTNIRAGGKRLWVNRSPKTLAAIKAFIAKNSQQQQQLQQPITAEQGWLWVEQNDIQ